METDDLKQKILQSEKLFNRALNQAEAKFKNGNLDEAVGWCQVAAHFASVRHCGFYASAPLENLLLRIAEKTGQAQQAVPAGFRVKQKDSSKKRLLFVATELYDGGGHTAFITRWIKNAGNSAVHSVVSTSDKPFFPQTLSSAVEESGGWHYSLSEIPGSLERAAVLRQIASDWADVVVLFVHPFDVLPTIAFGVEECPPVVFVNHADHQFWVGASITDVPVDYHVSGSQISIKHRGLANPQLLPIPLLKNSSPPLRDPLKREELGLKQNEVMLLSVAREEKFLPYDGVDFFEVMTRFLRQYPNVKLFVVGPENRGRWLEASKQTDNRIIVLGQLPRQSLEEVFNETDIYVPSFPCGSGSALLEACLHGIPVVGLANNELPHLTGQDDIAFENLPVHEPSTDKFLASLEKAINDLDSEKARAAKVKENVENAHCPPGWNSYLDKVLGALPKRHQIRALHSRSSVLDASDFYLAYLNSKMLFDELVEYSFARLIRVYSHSLSRRDRTFLQAGSLYEALPKVSGKGKVKEYFFNVKEFLNFL